MTTSPGAIPVSLSDSNGSIVVPEGITEEMYEAIVRLKTVQRGRLSQFAEAYKDAGEQVGHSKLPSGINLWLPVGNVGRRCSQRCALPRHCATAMHLAATFTLHCTVAKINVTSVVFYLMSKVCAKH